LSPHRGRTLRAATRAAIARLHRASQAEAPWGESGDARQQRRAPTGAATRRRHGGLRAHGTRPNGYVKRGSRPDQGFLGAARPPTPRLQSPPMGTEADARERQCSSRPLTPDSLFMDMGHPDPSESFPRSAWTQHAQRARRTATRTRGFC
jgi:hypothetical protein